MISIVIICDSNMRAFLDYGYVSCYLCKRHRLLSGSYWNHHISSKKFCHLTRKILIRCCKNRSLIFATRRRNTHVLSAPQLPHNWRKCVEIIAGWGWNMHRHIFTAIKSRGSLTSRNKTIPWTSQPRQVQYFLIELWAHGKLNFYLYNEITTEYSKDQCKWKQKRNG
jgi:hypothetical protein